MKHRNLIITPALAAALVILIGLSQGGCAGSSVSTEELDVYTEISAAGAPPPSPQRLQFPSFDPPKLLWITGLRTEMVQRDGSPAATGPAYRTDVGFEYMRHARIHHLPVYHTDVLFTLTPRQTHVSFPAGFGLPFYSDEVLTLTSTPLQDRQPSETSGARQRTVLEYAFEQDLRQPMKPLFAASGRWVQSPDGKRDRILRLPYDTRAHYITTPLHPRADSIELRDLSTGEIAYNSARNAADGATQAEDVSFFSGVDGIELLPERSYLLVDAPKLEETYVTSPALLYLRDKLFKKSPRKGAPVAHFDHPGKIADERLTLSTNHGEIGIAFYPELAPQHYRQIVELARLGVYDGVRFDRVEPGFLVQLGFPETRLGPPLTTEQEAALRRLEAEFSDLPMVRWTVAMVLRDNADPDSAVASFFILLENSRHLDQQYTIIGRVISGLETLSAISNLPLKDGKPIEPAFIEKAEVQTATEIDAGRKSRVQRRGAARD